jgi:hypothetical protein
VGEETRHITELFTDANVKVTFKTDSTVEKHSQTTPHIEDVYDNGGV